MIDWLAWHYIRHRVDQYGFESLGSLQRMGNIITCVKVDLV